MNDFETLQREQGGDSLRSSRVKLHRDGADIIADLRRVIQDGWLALGEHDEERHGDLLSGQHDLGSPDKQGARSVATKAQGTMTDEESKELTEARTELAKAVARYADFLLRSAFRTKSVKELREMALEIIEKQKEHEKS